MLILPETRETIAGQRDIVMKQCNQVLERILNKNSNVDHYYILGALRFDPNDGHGTLSLVPSQQLPTMIKDTFCYEVTKGGFKQLVWVTNGEDVNFVKANLKTKWCRRPPTGACAANIKGV